MPQCWLEDKGLMERQRNVGLNIGNDVHISVKMVRAVLRHFYAKRLNRSNKSNFNVTQPSKLPVVKVTTLLELLLHFRLVPIV